LTTFTPPDLAAGLAIDSTARLSIFACPEHLQVAIEHRDDETVAVLRSIQQVALVASIPTMQVLLARCALHLASLPEQDLDTLVLRNQITLTLHASVAPVLTSTPPAL
jgi:hypothetical protein